jgi:class 3 adenylate cyclase/predicted ATPase
MDLGAWLRSLGLAQYEAIFRENAIDAEILRDLTEDHLREMGLPLGARLKLLKAISALAPGGDPIGLTPAVAPASQSPDTAERRQVTVMFSDLVGSTALSARMDPEDLREVIAAYHKCVAEIVHRFDGFVAQYLGDGVLVYFGYPRAHEDDAERAVQAGQELVAAVVALGTRAPLQTRIGIATGLVVVGDLLGAGNARERGIFGETPNLAARLQRIAEPNMVVIAESTRRLLGTLFELEDLGAKAGPIRAWAVLRAGSVGSRFEALHATGLTALVGREEELELLLRGWSSAKSGEGQVVLLSGEAGIGKSRLTAAMLESLASEPHTRLRYFCSPRHTDSALYPIIGQLERAAGLKRDDTTQAKLDKLATVLAQTSTSAEDAALFVEMMSLPNDGRYPASDLTPQQRRQRTMEALIAQLETLARQNPLLAILEDAQWADPTSLEVFGLVVERIRTLRALLIVTFRPECDPPWGQSHVTALTVNRLTDRDIGAMIDSIVGDKPLAASIRQDIIERTDGIPLFVEEMTKAVLEAESERAAAHVAAAVPLRALAIPASLHASLMARLDRLGPAKEAAQIGAAIGREFSHAVLAAVMPRPEPELRSALDRLVAAGLLFPQGVPPHATYLFKHSLVQDVAYGTLLREPRRTLHARIAETLEAQFSEIAETQPELLAHHCTQAGLINKAANFWGKAGQRSLDRSALVEATAQFTQALDQIATLPGTPTLRREQIKLQVGLVNSLMLHKGFTAPETRASVEKAGLLIDQAETLGEPSEDPVLLFAVLYGIWAASFMEFNGDKMCGLATQFLALAEKQGATAPLPIAHRIMGTSLLFTGDIAKGREHFDRAIVLYDPAQHRQLATRFGQDIRVTILSMRSWALLPLGYPEAAFADTCQALSESREIGQGSTMYALAAASITYVCCRNFTPAKTIIDELIPLADERAALFWKAWGMLTQASLLAMTGKASNAIEVFASAITAYRTERGATALMPFHLSSLARAHAELGRFDDAWRSIGEALAAAETTKERWYDAETNRIAGEIALLVPEPDAAKAEAYFNRALVIGREQQAKFWELRAATSMARLWRDQARRAEARDLLAPIYRWFSEGFDTRDLNEAKVLLGTLT